MHSFLREDDVSFSRAPLETALAGQSAISKDLSFSDLDQLWAVMQPISFADCSLSRLSSVRQAGCAVLEVVGCWNESLLYITVSCVLPHYFALPASTFDT